MTEKNKIILSVVIAIIGALALSSTFNGWFHNDFLVILGVLIGFGFGVIVYKVL